MTFPGDKYAPPGVYVETRSDNPVVGALDGIKLPVLIGEGNEVLLQENLEVVRGSSTTVDQQAVQEDQTGRAVVSISTTNQTTLGSFDGLLKKFQVRHFPIVSGNGTGTTTTDRSAVSITVNNLPVIVVGVDGTNGIVELVQAPKATDEVRCTYHFNRSDTKVTEDLSDQVTATSAQIYANLGLDSGAFYSFNDTNNLLKLSVDRGSESTITIPLVSGVASFDAPQMASIINGYSLGSLVASTYTNNKGQTSLLLTADEYLKVGAGSANQVLGFNGGEATSRNATFFTFNGPIVDGTNGGVTSTDPSHITVKVDNIQIVPTSLDGKNRSFVLPFAPKAGSTLAITYYFNTWQDTFDYLANIGITDVVRCGITPDRNDYKNKADFILKDDTVIWGTSAIVSSGVHTTGYEYLGSKQVTATLVDNKKYLALCTAVVDTSVIPSVQSTTEFTLPHQPTSGNGRNSPLGSSLFQTVTNNRIDLPTTRPDLVVAYWGFSVQDALDRGPVTVIKVDSSTSKLTLKDPVPLGATVYSTFYYNVLTDETYTLSCKSAGSAGIGTYTLKDANLTEIFNPTFDNSTKSAGLSGITVEFPSGSEYTPDLRLESSSATTYTGPVEEILTVTFSETGSTAAKFTTKGFDSYALVENQSDKFRVKFDNADLAPAASGIDLSDPTAKTCGFFASLLGEEITYDASTGNATYTLAATNNSVSLKVDGIALAATVAVGGSKTADDFVTAINTAAKAGGSAAPVYKCATSFNAAYTVTATEYQTLTLHYTGDVGGATGNRIITLAAASYATATDLAAQVNTQLATINGAGAGKLQGTVTCTADASGRLVFTLVNAAADTTGYLEFVAAGTAANDFAIVAGIDTGSATNVGQMKLLDGDIARRFTVGSAPLNHDRIVLRNRLVPGGGGNMSHHHALSQTELLVQESGGNAKAGLTTNTFGLAGFKAVIDKPSVVGLAGFAGGQISSAGDATDSQPAIKFYDGTGAQAINNAFKFTIDGTPIAVTFTSSSAGTTTAIGPDSVSGTVMDQIITEMAALPGAPFGNAVAIKSANLIRQEGSGIRITSPSVGSTAGVVIGDSSANGILGFTDGASSLPNNVEAGVVASALMSHAQSGANFSTMMLTYASPAATYFAKEGLAGVIKDGANNEYLLLQSQTLGSGSIVELATSSADDALRYGTGFVSVAGDGAVGEVGISGFYVTSTDPKGSGTANTSVFNSGTGQDGTVGQTYQDEVTGVTFTVLPRTGGQKYPTASASFRFQVSKTVTTDANIPSNIIPGLELLVSNTSSVAVGDTAKVESFERGGNEPAIGDLYYISYQYKKQDFTTKFYTKLAAIEAAYGTVSPDNPVSLAAFLAMMNGAVLTGIKQVPKEEGSQFGSVDSYKTALSELAKPLPGGLKPDIITPMKTDSSEFYQFITTDADLQSSIRYRNERTIVAGFSGGTTASDAGLTAELISAGRTRFVYPEVATLNLTDSLGVTKEYLVDGAYLASALVGSLVSPNVDVATPWTGRQLVGFNQLAHKMDAVEQNQTAMRGITILEDRNPFIVVRQGFTSDMTNILTKTPTVIPISDEVQRRSRNVLDVFIGNKYMPAILGQVEGRLTRMFQILQQAQIVAAFTGVKASSTGDPTKGTAEAYWAPIFPLLYLHLRYGLRSTI